MFGLATRRQLPSAARNRVPPVSTHCWVARSASEHGWNVPASPFAVRSSRHMPLMLSVVLAPTGPMVRSLLYVKTWAALVGSHATTVYDRPVSCAALRSAEAADRHRSLLAGVLYTWISPLEMVWLADANVYV